MAEVLEHREFLEHFEPEPHSSNISAVTRFRVEVGAVMPVVQEVAVPVQRKGKPARCCKEPCAKEVVQPAITRNDIIVTEFVRHEAETVLASRDQKRGDPVCQDSRKPGKQRHTGQNLYPDQPEIHGLPPGDRLPVKPDFLSREDVFQDLTHTKSGLYQRRLRDHECPNVLKKPSAADWKWTWLTVKSGK